MNVNQNKIQITIYKHHYLLEAYTPKNMFIISKFARNYKEDPPRNVNVKHKQEVAFYGSVNVPGTMVRLHINTVLAFKRHLLSIGFPVDSLIVVKKPPPVDAVEYDLNVREKYKPLPHQVESVNYISDPNGPISRLVPLQMGKGKTVIALMGMVNRKKRFIICVLAKYVQKWIGDVITIMDLEREDIFVIESGKDLNKAIMGAVDHPVIIIGNRLLRNMHKSYEQTSGREGYKYHCMPDELMEKLGVDSMLIDEIHQEFHSMFSMSLHHHLNLIVGLSGTFKSNDESRLRMFSLMFPHSDRLEEQEHDKYVSLHPIQYNVIAPEKMRFMNNALNSYSHITYEQSLMRHRKSLEDYLDMIGYYVDISYIKRRTAGQKLMVYASSIKMVTYITNYLSNRFPDLDIRRYVEQDPYENCIVSDIRVSTILSSGTAIDIPDLITVLMTTSILSLTSNLQAFGRLRKIKGVSTRFYYLWCSDISKQRAYHYDKLKVMESYATGVTPMRYHNVIGSDTRPSSKIPYDRILMLDK